MSGRPAQPSVKEEVRPDLNPATIQHLLTEVKSVKVSLVSLESVTPNLALLLVSSTK